MSYEAARARKPRSGYIYAGASQLPHLAPPVTIHLLAVLPCLLAILVMRWNNLNICGAAAGGTVPQWAPPRGDYAMGGLRRDSGAGAEAEAAHAWLCPSRWGLSHLPFLAIDRDERWRAASSFDICSRANLQPLLPHLLLLFPQLLMRQPSLIFLFFVSFDFLAEETKLRKSPRLADLVMGDSQIYFIFMIVSITNNHARLPYFGFWINSNDRGITVLQSTWILMEIESWRMSEWQSSRRLLKRFHIKGISDSLYIF